MTRLADAVREAWEDDPEGIGRAVYELSSEALAQLDAPIPAPGEHLSVADLGDDLVECRLGVRHLAYWPRPVLLGRAAEIVRRAV